MGNALVATAFSCLQLCLHHIYIYSKHTHCSKGLQTSSVSTWASNYISTHRSTQD